MTANPNRPIENLSIGKIIEVDGTRIVAELQPNIVELSRVHGAELYAIGQFGSIVKVHCGRQLLFGYVGRLRMKSDYEIEKGFIVASKEPQSRVLEIDLFGEGEWSLDTTQLPARWTLSFERGISTFPLPQQNVYLTPRSELIFVYGSGGESTIQVGEHVGSNGTPCHAEINELLGKHTAILGSTGAGKSATVAVLLHQLLDRGKSKAFVSWHPRIVLLDPHNEYGCAFPSHRRLSTDEGSLSLPYWLLNLQETVNLLIGKTDRVATSQSNIVKTALYSARLSSLAVTGINSVDINVDSPTPYLWQDFVTGVDSQRPPGRDKKEQEPYNSVLNKLEVLQRDPRMAFMMRDWDGKTDPFTSVIEQFVGAGDPIRIVDLSAVPNEVAGLASAAIARTLFSFKLWQSQEEREADPTLLVCEEAHRYVPNRGDAQYEAAQEAIRRIAKEGRKYGLGLMLVSQRPSDVEATVLSQCNSWFVMRITNDADRDHVRGILPDSLAGLTKLLSGLRRREAIFVGQAVSLPSRILMQCLEKEKLPRSHDIDFDKGWQKVPQTGATISEIGRRWRTQSKDGAGHATAIKTTASAIGVGPAVVPNPKKVTTPNNDDW